jgi:hypothetical protein
MAWSKILRTGRRYSRAKQHDLLRFVPVSQCWEAFQARVSLLCVVLGFEPMKMSAFLLAARRHASARRHSYQTLSLVSSSEAAWGTLHYPERDTPFGPRGFRLRYEYILPCNV